MANNNIAAPNLPVAPAVYEQRYQDQFLSILRLFFTRITNKVNAPVPHGSFYDTTTQTNPVANAVNLMKVNSVYDSDDGTQYAVKKDTTKTAGLGEHETEQTIHSALTYGLQHISTAPEGTRNNTLNYLS